MQTEWNFKDANIEQNITLKPGRYKFECWGARGGALGTPYESGFYYGWGGYCSGEIILKKETILYLYVGKDGKKGYDFNGAGYGNGASGGGATDIRLVGGTWDNELGLLSRIIVAGGGGGTADTYRGGNGGGLKGMPGRGWNGAPYHGGTQFEGGKSALDDGSCDGSFGKGATPKNPSTQSAGGGGWFGGSCTDSSGKGSGGGSGYVLTKDSYKPPGYTPTSEYYFDNVVMITGGNTTVVDNYSDGRAKITLLQALPFLNISSYNSTTATFKADHTDPTLLTKIEYFIDDVLKETITTDLTTEKTINYTLEDNALHTLKIVVTDSANATVEKVLSISKGIAPLPASSTTDEVTSKWMEIKDTFKSGKTSIINTLALKNIEASLNNTLVELSEKIKTSFDSSDASVQDLMNQLTQANNTINQLNSKYKYASGTVYQRENTLLYACLYDPNSSHSDKIVRPDYWFDFNGIGFIPDLFFAELDYQPNSDKIFKYFVFVVRNIPSISNNSGFVVNIIFNKTYGQTTFSIIGELFALGKSHVYMNNNGIRVPVPYSLSNSPYNWHAIKFA
ncbi:glycine rich domain-containing protein [Clostridioides difficile]|uniref:glycine rich domain-containing protein n=1 Tax=Clostridioides difficile TaxID=1496 RepID=UPI0020C2B24C|nr:glycine rich domain-containing protein [Clostridioides difficile]MCP8332014.1 glycine rich domain-containing protein [Clostridioides difficile]